MRGVAAALASGLLASSLLGSGLAHAAEPGCAAPPALLAIEPSLTHVAARIAANKALRIVAIGSSSTQGIGASSPAMSYPTRLEAELKGRFPGVAIEVVNRGKGGEDAGEELARLDRDAVAERPDLVIWQVGTNAVLRHDDLAADGDMIERGIGRLKESGSDVILMDLQYAPRVLARPTSAEMQQTIANAAKRMQVGLFRRFDIMRQWQQAAAGPDSPMIGPDGLHMTDRGYGCLAADVAEAIAWNLWQYEHAPATHAPVVAGLAKPRPAPAAGKSPTP